MKLKTKMTILFFTIILVPLLFLTVAFFGISIHEEVDVLTELTKEDMMIGALISKRFMGSLLWAMIIILILTSSLITIWVNRDIYRPIKELSLAMKKIAEGDFEYRLENVQKGDIGVLYDNYEQMRLRLKENAEEKAQNEKKSKELVSNISHDLKTPITSIKGYVEGIMDGVADTPEKMDRYIKTIYNKANEMDRLINELTFYSKIDTNRIPYNFATVSANAYFSDCAEDLHLELEAKNTEFIYVNELETDCRVIVDPEQLRRVINNIVSNSVKYMDKKSGRIVMTVKDVGDFIQVELSDNGKGIAMRDLPYIFDRFYRTDASRNSSKGGSGIGLSIVKKIVEEHGGNIWATSEEGKGTTMYFVVRKYQEVPVNE